VGKTALAITLASDPGLRAQFPGGILWAALGPHPNVSEILSRWGALFGIAASGMGTLKDTEIWARTLQGVIGTRRFLIVIDDLWDIDAALSLKVGGPQCAYLATTRFPQIAASFAYAYAQEGLTIARQVNDEAHLCRLLTVCGVVKDETGDFTQAEKDYQEGLTLARKLHDQEQECILLIDLGANADYRGTVSEVHYFTQKALECARQLGHLEWQCVTLSNMSESYEQMGEYEQAHVL
jgi:tetratricopeptide (TPR) repeat protein